MRSIERGKLYFQLLKLLWFCLHFLISLIFSFISPSLFHYFTISTNSEEDTKFVKCWSQCPPLHQEPLIPSLRCWFAFFSHPTLHAFRVGGNCHGRRWALICSHWSHASPSLSTVDPPPTFHPSACWEMGGGMALWDQLFKVPCGSWNWPGVEGVLQS